MSDMDKPDCPGIVEGDGPQTKCDCEEAPMPDGVLPPDWDRFRNRLRRWWDIRLLGRCPLCREKIKARRVLLHSRKPRCSCCLSAGVIQNLWCCGLPGRRHARHRRRWTMRVCQLRHGLDRWGRPGGGW